MADRASNYIEKREKCVKFLKEFQSSSDDLDNDFKYMAILQEVANRATRTVNISMDDVLAFEGDEEFTTDIHNNARRYEQLFCEAIDELMPKANEEAVGQEDVFDVLHQQRVARQKAQEAAAPEPADENAPAPSTDVFPKSLSRRYEVHLIPSTLSKAVALRCIKAEHIGHLVRIRGMVTRVSNVKPLVNVATYTCDACGFEIYQEVNSRQFTPLEECPSRQCTTNKAGGRLHMQTRGSKFVKYQEMKVQELPDQVPIGRIPRSMSVVVRGELTRIAMPGDVVTLSGIFLPTPYTGYQAMRAGLIADTYLEAAHVLRHKKSYSEFALTDDVEERIDEMCDDPESYSKLARSIAPEIYGHEDVKKALLLMLVSGVTRELPDGMRIRGDINVCLMGDPGVAKSQLLKHIASVAPRGVYTTGKGSSGVGLTAAVTKDSVTGEMALEGGALVLADRGICAIDEFDKMDESDRTAIHEVMEQQTVSIAKAGITTTLNARTAVLAAANPLYGRYNRNLSPSANINLPNALLSRFDLLFLILDKADIDSDMALARHVTHVHRYLKNPELDFEPFDLTLLKSYISQARKLDPTVPTELTSYIVEAYVNLRMQEADAASAANAQTVMTARQLLSILRLAQALARLRFSETVAQQDVDEAMRLVHMSKASLLDDAQVGSSEDATSRVYSIIRDYAANTKSQRVKLSDIEPMVLKKGFSAVQLEACLEEYQGLNIWQVNGSRTHLDFTE